MAGRRGRTRKTFVDFSEGDGQNHTCRELGVTLLFGNVPAEERNNGRVEDWKTGILEDGRVEGWVATRMKALARCHLFYRFEEDQTGS